ncbi:NAD dependent epimerase/dehydratase [Xylariales sp. PMI_506]|nr:NAD dependent epimerase/dehydratase [Xylariales sp. PMI_506]
MARSKILLTGATGYVGGTVLNRLLACTAPEIKDVQITVLVRTRDGSLSDERIEPLEKKYGDKVQCIGFKGFDDLDTVTKLAAEHDVVVNAGCGFHPPSAEALVRGLAKRRKDDSTVLPWIIHTSGCSNISDRPLTQQPFPDREWLDAEAEKIYEFETKENAREWYPQRAAELAVLDAGEETGVGAVSIQAPCIFGTGEGLFQDAGLMIPIMMGYVLTNGYGFSLGDGVIDYIHVVDLAELYVLCVLDILRNGGANLPRGKKGILFPTFEGGRVMMRDIAKGCVETAFKAGALPLKKEDAPQEPQVQDVDLVEASTTTAGNLAVGEMGWGGHRKTKGTVAAERLGWNPVHRESAWQQDLVDELQFALAGKRGVTIDNCIGQT